HGTLAPQLAGVLLKVEAPPQPRGHLPQITALLDMLLGPRSQRGRAPGMVLAQQPASLVDLVDAADLFDALGRELAVLVDQLTDRGDDLQVLVLRDREALEAEVVGDLPVARPGHGALFDQLVDLGLDVLDALRRVDPPPEVTIAVVGQRDHVDHRRFLERSAWLAHDASLRTVRVMAGPRARSSDRPTSSAGMSRPARAAARHRRHQTQPGSPA